MKKTFLTIAVAVSLAGALPSVVNAQTSAVTNAILNQRSGLLDKARTDIDKAIVNEKTMGKAKTWYTRGEIYQGMLESPIYGKQLQPGEGVQKAYESYNKTIELDTKDGEFGKQAVARMDGLYGRAFNDAVNSYNAKEYDKAIESYKLASKIKPQDTTAVLYSAYASEAKQDYAGAKASYNQLLGMNYKSVTLYSRLLQMAKQQNDNAEAAKVVQQALAAYPTNKAFMLEDLNMSLASGKGEDALAKINKSIVADPGNSNLYAVRGSMYDQQKKSDLALADYKKAVELDPNNFDAQFNLGVYNYNKAADAYTKASKMDLKTYQASGKKFEAEGKKYFEASVPYFEKALQLQPDDRNTLASLQKVYFRLGRTADSERLNAKLQSLKK
ncbi:tetratricopeptide repeat protein [Hymenobacter negativus]|uniref:Tetratricopeptide repeat protein n=1 Tax=Hymenobacter negativus TaxID=2795026 RepID=A0ABS0Q354_9BACT|nr:MULTISPECIES: tetratricopeptide repeat protein [Bacteria]MBH8557101.1 tetratricopeptide repeat protein [Hymenobacter negativus]MBH8569394.1 tetratricopeptide repeat protein [Hymenobacter negativus]MBR7209129.1 tetratricopeptide repeat protein [Microvirga sp. STS02]